MIRPDVIDNTPEATGSGLLVAKSLAAAVTGADPVASVCRGTVVAVGQPRHPFHAEASTLAAKLERYVPDDDHLCQDAAILLRDLTRRTPVVSPGDDVLFAYDAGQNISLDDTTYILMREADLLAIVTPESEPA